MRLDAMLLLILINCEVRVHYREDAREISYGVEDDYASGNDVICEHCGKH